MRRAAYLSPVSGVDRAANRGAGRAGIVAENSPFAGENLLTKAIFYDIVFIMLMSISKMIIKRK